MDNEPIIDLPKDQHDEVLQAALKSIENGTLTTEQKNYLRDKFMGRDDEYMKLTGQEKADLLLQEWERSLISNMPDLEESKKEFFNKTKTIEIDESKDRIQNTHINIKSGKLRLVISSEGGRVITINNQEALEEYRQAVHNEGKRVKDEKTEGTILHNTREFS